MNKRTICLSLLGALPLILVGCSRNNAPAPKTAPPAPAPSPVAAPAKTTGLPLPESTAKIANYAPSEKQFAGLLEPANIVALTFDAGSDAQGVSIILKELSKRKTRATFFLTGKFCEQFPDEARAIGEAGMEIANHSYSHPEFTKLDKAKIEQQLEKAEKAILKATGRNAKPLFRFPYGDCDKRTREIVAEAGYQAIYWTVDSLDSVGEKKTEEFLAKRVKEKLQDGGISLMHVSVKASAQALAAIFDDLERRKIRVVPISELLLTYEEQKKKKEEAKRQKAEQKRLAQEQKQKEAQAKAALRPQEAPSPLKKSNAPTR